MIKKMIRIVMASLVSGGLLMYMAKIGMRLGILNTMDQRNLVMLLGIFVIMALNIQVFLEKEKGAI